MLNGATAGIGLVHALYCDLRFAADNTVFTTAFSRRGLIAEHGISWMLPRIVGHANALDLLMSARRVSQRGGAADRAGQSAVSARPVARADLCLCARSRRFRLAERDRRDQAPALRRAVPDAGRSHHRRQPGDGGGADAAAISAKASRASWRSGRRGLRGSEVGSPARRRPSGYAGHHASPFGHHVAAPRVARRAKRGGARRDRTADLVIANDALSQLSYGPIAAASSEQRRPTIGAIYNPRQGQVKNG